tara:strand:+ start:895 stop:1743 length:849 start_codon:yes stop_codon:yes gene_type:complete
LKNLKNNYLILGGDSSLGKAIINSFKEENINFISTTRNKKNICKNKLFFDFEQHNDFVIPSNISTVFFCAAITSIAICEKEKKKTRQINVKITCNLIKKFLKNNIYVVYFSTNLIFSGKNKYFSYLSKYAPQNEYAKQKILVEDFLKKQKNKKFTIIRFGKIFFHKDKLLSQWIINLKKNKKIIIIKDKFISPIYIKDAIKVIKEITFKQRRGIFQISASDFISYFEIAKIILKKIKKDRRLIYEIDSSNEQNAILKSNINFNKKINSIATIKKFLNDNNIY